MHICFEDKDTPMFFTNCAHSICIDCIGFVKKPGEDIVCPECRLKSNKLFSRKIKVDNIVT